MQHNIRLVTVLAATTLSVVASGAFAVSTYNNRTTYNTAAGAATATENFNGFAVDTPFNTVAVAANGFKIQQEGPGNFRNNVDVVPLGFSDNNGTNNASCFTNFAEGSSAATNVVITFPTAVTGFGADFYGIEGLPANAEGLQAFVYNGFTQLATYNFPNVSGNASQFFGVTAGPGEQITAIRFASANLIAGAAGEGFGIDDVALTVPEPVAALLLPAALLVRRRRR